MATNDPFVPDEAALETGADNEATARNIALMREWIRTSRGLLAILSVFLLTLLALLAFALYHATSQLDKQASELGVLGNTAQHQATALDRQNRILSLFDQLVLATPPRPGVTLTPEEQQILKAIRELEAQSGRPEPTTTPPTTTPTTAAVP